jgi:hypothetical protein
VKVKGRNYFHWTVILLASAPLVDDEIGNQNEKPLINRWRFSRRKWLSSVKFMRVIRFAFSIASETYR